MNKLFELDVICQLHDANVEKLNKIIFALEGIESALYFIALASLVMAISSMIIAAKKNNC